MKKNNILPTFFVLVLILSVPFWILGWIKPVFLLPGLPISALGAFVPALSGLILIYKSDRLPGVFQLLRRSFDFRRIRNAAWLLVVVIINPAITMAAYGFLRLRDGSMPDFGPLSLSAIPLFAIFFVAALGEEIGWTGYATNPLLARQGGLAAGLWLGSVWAAWHWVPLLQAQRSLPWIAWWSLGTLSLRVIMIWLYQHSGGSVFAASIFHAMINLCWQLFPIQGSYYDPRLFGLLTLLFAAILIIAEQLLNKNRFEASER